jgi:hypothetical protein
MITDGSSVMKVEVNKQAPKLHYIHPTCFEAGKPMEFFVCGSNLLQPKFRYVIISSSKHHLKQIFAYSFDRRKLTYFHLCIIYIFGSVEALM